MMKPFVPGDLVRVKPQKPPKLLELSVCIAPDGIFVTSIDVFEKDDKVWLVVGSVKNSPNGLWYYYVVGTSGCHGWTSARYLLERFDAAS